MSEHKTITDPYYVMSPGQVASDRFIPKPQSVVLLATLELMVRDRSGCYMLVTCSRYDEVESDYDESASAATLDWAPESAQWSPPDIARELGKPSGGWSSVRIIREAIAEGTSSWDAEDALERVLSTWACGLGKLRSVGSLTEYKRSWSSPQVAKVYHVLRYRAATDECDRRALADAESRKGFWYLPIEDAAYERSTRQRLCPRHKRTETLFLSRPMTSNLGLLVNDSETRRELREEAVSLDSEHFVREETGLLVCGDIAGYGAACSYALKMGNLQFGGDKAAEMLRDSASYAFMRLFHDAGIWQVHVAGDGFIAGMPLHTDSEHEKRTAIQEFFEAYRNLIELLDRFSGVISEHRSQNQPGKTLATSTLLGSRIAVHYGRYRYGKMGQAASLVSAFDGAAIIDVARLEQALSAMTKRPETAVQKRLAEYRHTAIASPEAVRAWGGARSAPDLLAKCGTAAARSKEFRGTAHVFGVVPETAREAG
jgi:hypothetical protein